MAFDRSEGSWSWTRPLIVLVFVIVAGLVSLIFLGSQVSAVLSTVGASVGTPGGGGVGQGNDGQEPNGGQAGGEDQPGGAGSGDGDGSPGSEVPLFDVTRPELLIIKTGEITLQVDDIDAALNTATRAIDRLGGYASGSTRSGTADEASASITFRIPVAAWDSALIALRDLGGTVLDEQVESEDVTAEVVDIEARVRNLKVTEAAFQSIMTSASAIKDVLTVQEELTTVRGEIEQLQSQATRIRDQAGLSTLSLNFRTTPAPVVAVQEDQFDPGAEADAATAHLIGIGQALAKVGIWLGIVWMPILIALGIVGGVGALVFRRINRRPPARVVSGM
jgi:preprotein translocase subunit SecG